MVAGRGSHKVSSVQLADGPARGCGDGRRAPHESWGSERHHCTSASKLGRESSSGRLSSDVSRMFELWAGLWAGLWE